MRKIIKIMAQVLNIAVRVRPCSVSISIYKNQKKLQNILFKNLLKMLKLLGGIVHVPFDKYINKLIPKKLFNKIS